MGERRVAWLGIGLVASGIILIAAAGALGAGSGRAGPWGFGPANIGSAPDPGSPGFVAGTTSAPRVVRILATPDLRFTPDTVRVQTCETVTFEVTTMGPTTHEFMVGPAAEVAADKEGTPEIADIGMMATKSLFAFACHEPGHYEAGMTGTIAVVP